MSESEPLAVNPDVVAAHRAGGIAYLLEFFAIVLLTALAAYAASSS